MSRAKWLAATVTPAPVPAPLSTTLSPQASELVRWYCGITRHREGDAVEGAVYGVFERARASYADHNFDEGFNFVLEDVLTGMNDEMRQSYLARYGGGTTVQLSIEASELLHRALEADEDPRDVINGCVESMLASGLDNTALEYQSAIAAARHRRLDRQRQASGRLAALRSYAARPARAVAVGEGVTA